ncbi:hypothetical protein CWR43_16660 [Rhizobium sullae]|uniref:Membrane transporter protein n=1 Tax=Rhizobium sullae TaxID=50338 RepID=A0A2N0D8L1_RHISU|nr:hypothetical protein [Rhizobium sullae]PKA42453.1 hypothetical protein CWR43_16660 [Rhizobium sullae]
MPAVSELFLFALMLAAAGAVADLLAGLIGIGGGAILVPVFYQVFGWLDVPEVVRMHLSVGTSLAIIAVVLIIPLTMYIAPIGARLAHRMSKRQLEIGFGIFLIVTGARFLIRIYE